MYMYSDLSDTGRAPLSYNTHTNSTALFTGNYGSSGMEEFKEMLEEHDICLATEDRVEDEDNDEIHDLVIEKLLQTENARVVVCFCEGLTIRRLLQAAGRKNAGGRFLFLGRCVYIGAIC